MTIGKQEKQAIANLKSVQASFEQLALQTESQQTKKVYGDAAQQTTAILKNLEPIVRQKRNSNIKAIKYFG